MTEYIWRVDVEAEYEKDVSDEPSYDVLAVDLTDALRKVHDLVPKEMEDEEDKPNLELKGYVVVSAVRGVALDA